MTDVQSAVKFSEDYGDNTMQSAVFGGHVYVIERFRRCAGSTEQQNSASKSSELSASISAGGGHVEGSGSAAVANAQSHGLERGADSWTADGVVEVLLRHSPICNLQ